MPAPIVEYLKIMGTDRPSFVVTDGAADVVISTPVRKKFTSALGFTLFIKQDNVLILSAGVRLPYCFCFGSEIPNLRVNWLSEDLAFSRNCFDTFLVKENENGLDGSQFPGQFFQHPAKFGGAENQRDSLTLEGLTLGRVGVVNAPTVLVGTTQYLDVWLKVQHLEVLA